MRDIAGEVGDTVILGMSPDKPSAQAKFDEKGKVQEAWYKVSPKDTPLNLTKALAAG
jgi:peroxiredoxin